MHKLLTTPLALALLATPAFAAVTSDINLTFSGDADKKTVTYSCESHAPLPVTYINAPPNFLAIVPITDDETGQTTELVFASVVTASGARYEAAQYIWWNKGTDAFLYDTTEGADAAPLLTCSEIVETP